MFLSLRFFKYFSHVSQFKDRRLHNGFGCFPIQRFWANFPTFFSSVLFHNLSYSDAFASLNRSSIQLKAALKRRRCLLILDDIPSLNCLMMLIGLEEYVSVMCSHFFQFRGSRVTSVVDRVFLCIVSFIEQFISLGIICFDRDELSCTSCLGESHFSNKVLSPSLTLSLSLPLLR